MQYSKVNLINKLQVSGLVPELYKLGLVNSRMVFYANAYNYYDAQFKTSDEPTKRNKRIEAVKKTAHKFKIERRTVYNIISAMESQVIVTNSLEKFISIASRN